MKFNVNTAFKKHVSGHVYCSCGRAVVCTNPNPTVVEHIQRNIQQKFELLTTLAFLLIKEPPRGRKWKYFKKSSRKVVKHIQWFTIREE